VDEAGFRHLPASARMAELVDAVDSKSTALYGCASSTLAPSTTENQKAADEFPWPFLFVHSSSCQVSDRLRSVNNHVQSTWLCFSPPQGGCGLLESNNLGDCSKRGHMVHPRRSVCSPARLGNLQIRVLISTLRYSTESRASEIPGLPAEPMDSDHVQSSWVSNAN
jgi:hypothetical protein